MSGTLESTFLHGLLSWVVPTGLFIGVWFFLLRHAGTGLGSGVLTAAGSRARLYVEQEVKVTFADVTGVDEAGAPFFSISGSEFVEMFVGVGAARVRDLFLQAKEKAPCIIFIDELDALGKVRGAGALAHEKREQTLNQLLVEMDGFDTRAGVILMAATNRPEILDPALLRAGRFDRHVLVDHPDRAGRLAILRLHARGVVLRNVADLDVVAGMTPGFAGADLANVVNEAALLGVRRNKEAVELQQKEIITGAERAEVRTRHAASCAAS